MTVRFHASAPRRDGKRLVIITDEQGGEHARWARRKRVPWLFSIRFRSCDLTVRRIPGEAIAELV